MKARKRASEADVVVVNHHLFFADVVLRDEGAADLLPAADTVIFDEAHHLPDLARLFFGQSLSTTQVIELARDARMAEAQHAREGTASWERPPRGSSAPRATCASRWAPVAGRTALAAIGDRAGIRSRARRARRDALRARARRSRRRRSAPRRSATAAARADAFLARVHEWREADARPREDAFAEAGGAEFVRWIEAYPHSAVLYVTPLDVARIFHGADARAPSARGSSPPRPSR